ncbi:MAG: hypothetical protein KGH75_05830 [Rhodospirillales bacterium]|nr:hypothetical protein [Rhodospirillales bacterium]
MLHEQQAMSHHRAGPPGSADVIRFVIHGQAASKANSRKLVVIHGRPASIKSDAARNFERLATLQIPAQAKRMLTCRVAVVLRMFYRTELPDLDESIVLDVMQAKYKTLEDGQRVLIRSGVYVNDRQVRERHTYHGVDPQCPRVEVEVWPMQLDLPTGDAA